MTQFHRVMGGKSRTSTAARNPIDRSKADESEDLHFPISAAHQEMLLLCPAGSLNSFSPLPD
jgi:hypothetical protein